MSAVDIIIFGGQSNMQGQSERLSENRIVDDAYEYKFIDDVLVELKNPVGENITYTKECGTEILESTSLKCWLENHLTGSACYGNTNLVPEFVIGNTKQKVVAVHISKGSTQIADWMPETLGYEIIKEKASSAIKKVKEKYSIDKIFFVWLQGESDAIAGNSKAYYKEKLYELFENLKKDLKVNKFCIIRVGRFTNDNRDMEIICAQDEICRENNDFIMLTEIATQLNESPEYMNPSVAGHYSAAGLEKLGMEAGKALRNFKETESLKQ